MSNFPSPPFSFSIYVYLIHKLKMKNQVFRVVKILCFFKILLQSVVYIIIVVIAYFVILFYSFTIHICSLFYCKKAFFYSWKDLHV